MKNKLITYALLAILSSAAHAAVVFNDSFAGFADGPLNGQGSWGSQAAFTVSAGAVTANNAGSFARAQRFGGFRPEVGDQVRITVSGFSITDNLGNGSDQFRFGIAALPENTGDRTPQVGANVALSAGTSLTIGGATDTSYDLGDELTVVLTLTRTGTDSWSLDSSITNVTDGSVEYTGSATPTNDLGQFAETPPAGMTSSLGDPLGSYLDEDPDNQAQFGMRLLNNGTSSRFNFGGVQLEHIPVPEPSTSIMLLSALTLGLLRRRRC